MVALGAFLFIALAQFSGSSCDDKHPQQQKSSTQQKGGEVCPTTACDFTADEILKRMDTSVKPCDNFHGFVCGTFLKNAVLPPDKTRLNDFAVVGDKVIADLRSVLEQPSQGNEPRPFKLAKDFYKACMDTGEINRIGKSEMMGILTKLGGWPVLDGDKWNSNFDWKQFVYKCREIGYSFSNLIDLAIAPDTKNPKQRIIYLDQPYTFIKREYLIKGMNDDMVKAAYNYMVDIAVMFGADRDRATKEMKEALEFEMKIAHISKPKEERRDSNRMYNPKTIPEMQTKYPYIPWAEYLNKLMGGVTTLKPDEVVVVNECEYLTGLENLLNTTPKRTLANYLLWRVVSVSINLLTEDVRKRLLDYATITYGQKERKARWKECVYSTTSNINKAAGALYVSNFVKPETKAAAETMVNMIRDQMVNTLKTASWMDEGTRKNAIDKANAMASVVGYPEQLTDMRVLESFYAKANVDPKKYLTSALTMSIFGWDNTFRRLREPVLKGDWVTHGDVTNVNAFYYSDENTIELPGGILGGIFFSTDRPNYLNYGAVGTFMGHEFTHGFDDEGSQNDKDGCLMNWWDPKTKKAYEEKAKCIIDQYSNYKEASNGKNVNGISTQGENIADNGGVKIAYRAYNQWMAEHGPEKQLRGLQQYSPQQMFWISYATMYCTKYSPEVLKLIMDTDAHTPDDFRVIGTLSNNADFAKDFNCPVGSKMNPPPEKKCQVW